MKKILYIDMDNVLVDFMSGARRLPRRVRQQFDGHLDDAPGIFALMKPMPGAVAAFAELARRFDTYILSTAPWNNPSAWVDKLLWVKKHLGDAAYKRLIITHHKDLNRGDFLIDDRTKHGASEFCGEHILFGSKRFPNWRAVMAYLRPKGEGNGTRMTRSTRMAAEISDVGDSSISVDLRHQRNPRSLLLRTSADMLERAIAIAAEVHQGQKDKGGWPYILHPLRVMLAQRTDDARIVAVLHDVVEDGEGWTPERLAREGFSRKVLAAIESVTRRKGTDGEKEPYMSFVARARRNALGRAVKRADLLDNMDLSRIPHPTAKDLERVRKYRRALKALAR